MTQKIDLEKEWPAITTWLASRIPGASELAVTELERPRVGNSAETIFVTASYRQGGTARTRRMVLRRQLQGNDLMLGADLGDEYRLLESMRRHPRALAPVVVGFEPDGTMLGTPFYVMDRVEGRPVQQYPNYNKEGWLAEASPDRRRQVWQNAIEKLAEIHRIDWRDGFEFLSQAQRGAPGIDQYLHHLNEWYKWAAKGRAHPFGDAAIDYLQRNRPDQAGVGVLWGDAIPANLLFDERGEITAVIDWELAGLGPGEIDLGWWLFFDGMFSSSVERLPGLPTREETIAMYEEAAGRQVHDMFYFELLANFRLSIIAIRQADRQVAFGTIPATSRAWIDNPVNRLLARKLGLPEPDVGEDFATMQRARAH
jgi:aminoglycoside phosphotransferase (APT) family kinase protein